MRPTSRLILVLSMAVLASPFARAQWLPQGATSGPIYYNGGNVGIGPNASAPVSLLHIAGTNGVGAITLNTPGAERVRLQSIPGILNWGAFTLNANYAGGWNLDETTINGWFFKLDNRGNNGKNDSNGLWLYRVPNGPNPHRDEYSVFGVTNGMVYARDQISIGNMSPPAGVKLEVTGAAHFSGDVTVDGNIAAKFQDVAEWVPSNDNYAAGTVVVLDPSHNNRVTASNRAYDTTVAGVVSHAPGVLLGVASKDKSVVATTGRVPVRVDATRAPIHIGDLLVTSDVPGTAMKSIPVDINGIAMHRPGTLIGKALEPLESGQGEILVLLSLQ